MRNNWLVSALAASLLLMSCEKNPTGPASVKDLLVDKNWKWISATINPGINVSGVVVTDWYAQMGQCAKDGTTRFSANGTYTDDEGPTKCDPADPQTVSGTWVLNPGETILTMTVTGGAPQSSDIESLTATSAVLSITTSNWSDGLSRKMTIGLTAY